MGITPTKFTPAARRAFCEYYSKTGRILESAELVGVNSETVRVHRKTNSEFDEQVKQAYQRFQDTLEREAFARAVEGWQEPVFQRGELVGHVLKKSDRILELVLKRHIPPYRDRQQVDMTVTGGVLVVPQTPKTSEEWEKQQEQERET